MQRPLRPTPPSRRRGGRAHPSTVLRCVLGIALGSVVSGCGESEPATPAAAPAPPVEAPAEIPPLPEGEATSWALEEFDWGDSEEVVQESVDFAPNYLCFGAHGECRVVRVRVDGEDLLARFQYAEDALWRVAILTPPLYREDAAKHGPRVAARLAGHVSRQLGDPERVAPFPSAAQLKAMPEGSLVLERWRSESLDVETRLVHRDGDRYVIAAYFADPVRAKTAAAAAPDPTDPPPKPVFGDPARPGAAR